MLNQDEIARYLPQIKLTEIGFEGQTKLKHARVLCIGAGGLGSSLLFYLAAAGVGTLAIMDDDVVEVSNLQRQILYTPQHLGMKKVTAAKIQLAAFNPHLQLVANPSRLTLKNAADMMLAYDIVADCSDNLETRYLINDVCFRLNKPFVFASVSGFKGQCSLFLGQRSPCFRCLFPRDLINQATTSCQNAGILGIVPGLLGMIEANEILKWILNLNPLLVAKLLIMDVQSMQSGYFEIVQDPNCPICREEKIISTPENFKSVSAISALELQAKIRAGEAFLLLDVRSEEERRMDHLGGIHIPLQVLMQRLSEVNLEDEIIVYCHAGVRSLYAANLLMEAGAKSVKNLTGGIEAFRTLEKNHR